MIFLLFCFSVTFADDLGETESDYGGKLPVLQTAMAVAVSVLICKVGTNLAELSGIQGASLPFITAIVVVLATVLPRQFAYLAPSGDAIAQVLLQVISDEKFLCIDRK